MRLPDSLSLLLIVALSPNILALTVPPPLQLPSSNITSLGAVGQIFCTKKSHPFARERTPIYGDCLAAIEALPQSTTIGAFHRSGPNNPFKLPYTQTSGKCAVAVMVNTGRGATTAASWYDIWHAASQVNNVCVSNGKFTLYTGGWTDLAAGAFPPGPEPQPDPDPAPGPAPYPRPDPRGRIYVRVMHSSHLMSFLLEGRLRNGTLENSALALNASTGFDAVV